MFARLFKFLFWLFSFVGANAFFGVLIFLAVVYQQLPDLKIISDYRPRLPMRVFSADGVLIGEFGEERRTFAKYKEFPSDLINALLATEDVRFYQHYGVDFVGVGRAALGYAAGRREGASTITMQLARNFYLKRDRTLLRKVVEIMLALKIEQQFSKEAILERYMNQIYLGNGSYGFTAAAREYYDKDLDELTIGEIAVLVGLPKSPSKLNPRRNPSAAKARQRHVLKRMRDINILGEAEYLELNDADLPALAQTARRVPGNAPFVAERARQIVFDAFGDDAYERGLNIYTTIQSDLQAAAVGALRQGLLAYEGRRDYPGPEQYIDTRGWTKDDYLKALRDFRSIGGLQPAIVTEATAARIAVITKDGSRYTLTKDALKLVRQHLPKDNKGRQGKTPVINKGSVVRLQFDDSDDDSGEKKVAQVVSVPGAQAAFVAVSSDDGAILALVGGFDFSQNQFNNVYQARRQPGSSIKPFIFSAALEKGIMPASTLPDTPIFLTKEETGSEESWQPKNYDGKAEGDITMRHALAKSKNLATVHLLKLIRPDYARDFLLRFGFRREDHFPYLTLGLGAGVATPIEMARGYAVFANGGYLVNPYIITRIEDYDGNVIVKELDYTQRQVVIDKRNAFITRTLLQSVIQEGTGASARSLARTDIGGKTGTTNNTQDAWFTGFGGDLTAVAWVGYPQLRSLGDKETGARAALPIWRDFMQAALNNQPQLDYTVPSGVIIADVDATSGKLLFNQQSAPARKEFFYSEYLPIAIQEDALPESEAEELL